jgi:SsrA-binding protein
VSIAEAFARPKGDELWLLGMNIKPYAQANVQNHEPLRPRKLLLHRREIDKIVGKVAERGFTLIPLLLYWKHGIAKVLIAVARGKRQFDKRETIKKREADREIRRERGRRR